MKITPKFHVEELLHPAFIRQFGLARCYKFLETNCQPLLHTLETERSYFGESMTINNYLFVGETEFAYIDSGVRYPCDPIGDNFSPHYGFGTVDIKYETIDVLEVQQVIVENPMKFPFVRRIENPEHTRSKHGKLGRDWSHQETGLRLPGDEIKIFNP